MRRTSRLTRSLAVLGVLTVVSAGAAVVTPTTGSRPSSTAAAATAPTLSVMGQSELTATDLVRYYNSVNHLPLRVVRLDPFSGTTTPVSIDEIANLFVSEGNRYNVRGDVAFAQSIVETAWFNFPDYGQVRPWNNNFAGIGACDSCNNGYQFPSLQIGVRAQMQLLRDYADAFIQAANLPDPPLPSLWGSTPQRAADNFNFFSHKGRAPYWSKSDCSSGCMGNGNWATSPIYSTTVTGVYSQMLAFVGRTLAPETIDQHYAALGGSGGFLGAPQGSEQDVSGLAGARMRTYAGGTIYWSAATGAHEVHGGIRELYLNALGGPTGPLGLPLTDEAASAAGGGSRFNNFQGGGIFWSSSTGAHAVRGAIAFLYGLMGGPGSFLGLPTTDEAPTPDGVGRFSDFQGGSIYWSPATGVHEVHGGIGDLYRSLGGPASTLGLPVGDERAVPGGRSSAFQGGEIFSSPSTGVHEVRGAIAYLYGLLGGPASFIGLPTTGEQPTPDGVGRFNTFQRGSIYWSPATGVHQVQGTIGDLYRSLGGPASVLGYPVSNERDVPGGRSSLFQGGEIFWSPSTGTHVVKGVTAFVYGVLGGPGSFLGLPTADEVSVAGGPGTVAAFQGGAIYSSPSTGIYEVHGAIYLLYLSLGGPTSVLGFPTTNELSTSDGVGRFSHFQNGLLVWLPVWGAFRLVL